MSRRMAPGPAPAARPGRPAPAASPAARPGRPALARRRAALAGPLGLLALLAAAAPAVADGTVIARATDVRGGVWTPCGGIHAVGWVVYDLVSVVEGESPGARFAAVHSCPGPRLRGELRLVLRSKRPRLQPALSGASAPPAELPRFYAIEATPEAPAVTRRARRRLGQTSVEVEAALARTGADGDWVQYGPDLALRYAGDRVVALRARVALGMSCEEAAAWLGWVAGRGRGFPLRRRPACEWPGISERHRLERGVAGRLEGEWFEAWQR